MKTAQVFKLPTKGFGAPARMFTLVVKKPTLQRPALDIALQMPSIYWRRLITRKCRDTSLRRTDWSEFDAPTYLRRGGKALSLYCEQ